MASRAPAVMQALRSYTTKPRSTSQDRLGMATATAYWCAVVSAPLASAFYISQNAAKDKRFASLPPLSFRDCLPGSRLEDYAGAYTSMRR